MSNVDQKIYEILSNVLEIEVNENTHISMQNCQEWTSLAHIDIIMSVEEEFDIVFGQDDLPNLTSQALLIEKTKELLQ
ncbi:MAG: acyl carrier protein [Helicobacter sp.]|nr:acyl carrier protein [Helicobacter sp.]